MSSQDDPEARIRELERTLSDQSSELVRSGPELGAEQHASDTGPAWPPPYGATFPSYAPPPPPPPPPWGPPTVPYGVPYPPVPLSSGGGGTSRWAFLGLLTLLPVVLIGGAIFYFSHTFSAVTSVLDTMPGSPTVAGGGGGHFSAPGGGTVAIPTAPAPPPTVPAGADLSVSGVGQVKTIACDDNPVDVSGVSNEVVLTGQCRSVTVSGVQNTVTVDAAGMISASGFDNRVTYHSGTPDIRNSGDTNVVEHG